MKRRTLLASGVTSVSAVAGCLGGSGGGETDTGASTPLDADEDGYPPTFEQTPAKREVDVGSFDAVEQHGQQVPLAPIEAAHYWYKRREARFVDARSESAYSESHIYGAVSSPVSTNAGSSSDDSDPVKKWAKGDRIVCYCGCPHHLSSMRAAELLRNGYENVYVIDEGFWEWHDRNYPMAGTNVEGTPEKWVIRGETDAGYAGRDAWARHRPSGQMEATDITADGSYELHLKFHEVDPDSTIAVETPGYTVEGELKDLASGTVQG